MKRVIATTLAVLSLAISATGTRADDLQALPDAVRDELRMYNALINNNCNWDDATNANHVPPPYPTIAKIEGDTTAKRAKYLALYGVLGKGGIHDKYDNSAIDEAENYGNDFGVVEGPELAKNCAKIEAYAKTVAPKS